MPSRPRWGSGLRGVGGVGWWVAALLSNTPHVWPRHLVSLVVRLRGIPRHYPIISVEGRYLRIPGTVVEHEDVQPIDADDHEDVVRQI